MSRDTEPLWVIETRANIEDGWFVLANDDYPETVAEFPDGVWLRAGVGWVAAASEGDDFYPRVRFEAWPWPPPDEPLPENTVEATLTQVEFTDLTMEWWSTSQNSGPVFTLPPDGGDGHTVRVRRTTNPGADHDQDDDLETWRIQVWAPTL